MLKKIKTFFKKKETEKLYEDLKKRKMEIARKKYEGIIERLTLFVLDSEFMNTGLLLTNAQARKIAVNYFNEAKADGILDEMNNVIRGRR